MINSDMGRATKQPDKELSEGPAQVKNYPGAQTMINSDEFRATTCFQINTMQCN